MKEVTPHLTILKIVPRLFIKLSNLGIMLSDANNIHLKQEIHGLHCLYYMYVRNNRLTCITIDTKYEYNTKMQCIVTSLYIS